MAKIWCGMDTMQIKSDQDAYNCPICSNIFTSPIQLTVHCICVHKLLPCMQCLLLFGTEKLLNEHTLEQHVQRSYNCLECRDVFTIEKDLCFHMTRKHFKKQCPLCISIISYDEFQNHVIALHKITNATAAAAAAADNIISIENLCIVSKNHKQFHCHLCQDKKSMNRLEKLMLHFLYFHKLSLQSLLRCIFVDSGIDSLQWMNENSSDNDDSTLANKCESCDLAYSWLVPKIFHQIYCRGSIYCANCQICFVNQEYDAHSKICHNYGKELPAIKYCNVDCNIDDVIHLKTVHNFSGNFDISKLGTSLINSQNDCNFCGRALGDNQLNGSSTLNLDHLIRHFCMEHKFNENAILRGLNKQNDAAKMKAVRKDRSASKRSLVKSSNLNKFVLIEHEFDDTSVEYRMSFATNVIRYVYSSESDYDSLDTDDNADPTHERITSVERSYRCDLCEHWSKSKYLHAMHLHQKHEIQLKSSEFWCNICRKQLKSANYLKKHNQKLHHKQNSDDHKKRFKCVFCEFRCNAKSRMRRHIGEHVEASYHPCTSKMLGFNCRFCHMAFWTREKLNEHQFSRHSEHIGETYLLCSLCFSAFNNLLTLRNHNSTRHFDRQRQQNSSCRNAYQCKICCTVSFSMAEIEVHMKDLHPDLQSMFCAKVNCAQIVSNEDQLKYHWAMEHSKLAYQCLKCFKRFENEQFIQNHMRNAHHVEKGEN